MRMAGIRELQNDSAALLGGKEPVLVTRHGKVSGLYVPLEETDRVPDDLRRELAKVLGAHLAGLIDARGTTAKEILEDFRACRRRRYTTLQLLRALETGHAPA